MRHDLDKQPEWRDHIRRLNTAINIEVDTLMDRLALTPDEHGQQALSRSANTYTKPPPT